MASLTSKAQDPATVTDNRPQAKWQELKQFAMLYEFRHLSVGAQQVDKVRNVAQKVVLGQSPQCTTPIHQSLSRRGSALLSACSAQPLPICCIWKSPPLKRQKVKVPLTEGWAHLLRQRGPRASTGSKGSLEALLWKDVRPFWMLLISVLAGMNCSSVPQLMNTSTAAKSADK